MTAKTTPPAERTDAEKWEELTKPFPESWIERLPKPVSRDDNERGRCVRNSRFSADGHYCNGWHARAVHLDYVGHAGITMRLNDVVGPDGWSWEPLAFDSDGIPMIERRGEFWIRLTILGVAKYGVGDDYPSAKVAIGDALRNAAMRFGIGTYLWAKSDHAHGLSSFADTGSQPTVDVEAIFQRVRSAWNHPAGLRIMLREVDEAQVGDRLVAGPGGDQQPIRTVILDRQRELDERTQNPPQTPAPAPASSGGETEVQNPPEEPQEPAGAPSGAPADPDTPDNTEHAQRLKEAADRLAANPVGGKS